MLADDLAVLITASKPTADRGEDARPRRSSSLWEAEGEKIPTENQPLYRRRRQLEEMLGTGLLSNVFHRKKKQITVIA